MSQHSPGSLPSSGATAQSAHRRICWERDLSEGQRAPCRSLVRRWPCQTCAPTPHPGAFKTRLSGFLGASYFLERDFEKVRGGFRTAPPAGPSWADMVLPVFIYWVSWKVFLGHRPGTRAPQLRVSAAGLVVSLRGSK